MRCLVLVSPWQQRGRCLHCGRRAETPGHAGRTATTDRRQGRQQRPYASRAMGAGPWRATPEFDSNSPLPDIAQNSIVIDGLLGIGCDRAPTGLFEQLINHVNTQQHQVRVYALDCPSGLNCDTGLAPGAAVQAHTTFSYMACKHGLLTCHGKTLAGNVWVDDLGCEALLDQLVQTAKLGPMIHAPSRQEMTHRLPVRSHQHHKGSFGSIAVLGGQRGMVGACLLSARTALMLGCGRVALSLLTEGDLHLPDVQLQGQTPFMDVLFPEIMNKGIEENLTFADVAVVGPGLGQSEDALQMLLALLEHDKGLHMVWDADALNLLASSSALRARFQHYRQKHAKRAMVFTLTRWKRPDCCKAPPTWCKWIDLLPHNPFQNSLLARLC